MAHERLVQPACLLRGAPSTGKTIYNPDQGLYFATDYPLASGEVVVRDFRTASGNTPPPPDSLGRCVVPVPATPLQLHAATDRLAGPESVEPQSKHSGRVRERRLDSVADCLHPDRICRCGGRPRSGVEPEFHRPARAGRERSRRDAGRLAASGSFLSRLWNFLVALLFRFGRQTVQSESAAQDQPRATQVLHVYDRPIPSFRPSTSTRRWKGSRNRSASAAAWRSSPPECERERHPGRHHVASLAAGPRAYQRRLPRRCPVARRPAAQGRRAGDLVGRSPRTGWLVPSWARSRETLPDVYSDLFGRGGLDPAGDWLRPPRATPPAAAFLRWCLRVRRRSRRRDQPHIQR